MYVGNVFRSDKHAGESLYVGHEFARNYERAMLGALDLLDKQLKRAKQERLQDKVLKQTVESQMVEDTARNLVERFGSTTKRVEGFEGRSMDYLALQNYIIYKDNETEEIGIYRNSDRAERVYGHSPQEGTFSNDLTDKDIDRFKSMRVMLEESRGYRSYEQKSASLRNAYAAAGVAPEEAAEAARIKTQVDGFLRRTPAQERAIRNVDLLVHPAEIAGDTETIRALNVANELVVTRGANEDGVLKYQIDDYSVFKHLEDNDLSIFRIDIDGNQHVVAAFENGIIANNMGEIDFTIFRDVDNQLSQEYVINQEIEADPARTRSAQLDLNPERFPDLER